MPHDIFISYSRRDLPSVRPIKEELEHLGFSCWMDLQGIESGSPEFTQKIAEAIIGSKVVLFFLSVHSQQSPYALNELRAARAALKRPPVLVQFNDDRMSIPFILEFGGADIIDWRKPEQKEKLLHNLREWAGTVQTGDLSAAVSKPIGTWSTGTGVIECPICGRKNLPKDTFHCRECGRDNLCLRHQDDNTYLCQDCALKKMQNPAFDKTPASAILESQKVCSSGKSDIFQNASLDSAKRKGDPSANGPLPGDVRRIDLGTVSFNLRWIPPDEPQAGFWMGETPVTQELWTAVMGSNPSRFGGDFASDVIGLPGKIARKVWNRSGRNALRPVECVCWDDCWTFIEKVNALDSVRSEGLVFRLPSEEEWEFVCHAGGTGEYCRLADGTEITAKTLGRVAWFHDNSGGKTHPVGVKEPNAWGLRDMLGNVCEWTQTANGGFRVLRGGSWDSPAGNCVASRRWKRKSDDPGKGGLGFRICASVSTSKGE